jgi:hypothetical protein
MEDKLYMLLVPDRVKHKVWHFDFADNSFKRKKIIDIELTVPNKSVEVLLPRIEEVKPLVRSLLQDIYSPVIKLFNVSAVAQHLNAHNTTAKQLIQELAITSSLMLQVLLTHSEVCSIERLLNLYWNDFNNISSG